MDVRHFFAASSLFGFGRKCVSAGNYSFITAENCGIVERDLKQAVEWTLLRPRVGHGGS